jgi:CheY-like chemotaxis protein
MGDKKRVLIIDDERDICQFTKTVLERNGRFEVFVSSDSTSGIEMVKRNKPDIILLDINMPGLDGGDIAQTLGDFSMTRDIPIIFVTGLLKKEELALKDKGKVGRHYFIAKPVTPKELIEKIEAVLNEVGL